MLSVQPQDVFCQQDFPVEVLFRSGIEWSPCIPHCHSEIECSLVCEGHGHYFVRDRTYELKAGSLLVIRGNDIHSSVSISESSITRLVLVFAADILGDRSSAASVFDGLSDRVHFSLSESETTRVELLFREIDKERHLRKPGWQEMILCDVEKFLIILSRVSRNESFAAARSNPLVQEVAAYLETAYAERLTLEEIGSRFSISESGLSRAFKACTGIGFKEFLIHRRIIEAKRLLKDTNYKIARIAYEVGFDNLSVFNRNFKHLTGISPSYYRAILHSDVKNSS